jgi:hypothetical protein
MHDTAGNTTGPSGEKIVSPTRARAGATGHNVRYVLAISLTAIVIAFAAIYLAYFA